MNTFFFRSLLGTKIGLFFVVVSFSFLSRNDAEERNYDKDRKIGTDHSIITVPIDQREGEREIMLKCHNTGVPPRIFYLGVCYGFGLWIFFFEIKLNTHTHTLNRMRLIFFLLLQ